MKRCVIQSVGTVNTCVEVTKVDSCHMNKLREVAVVFVRPSEVEHVVVLKREFA